MSEPRAESREQRAAWCRCGWSGSIKRLLAHAMAVHGRVARVRVQE